MLTQSQLKPIISCKSFLSLTPYLSSFLVLFLLFLPRTLCQGPNPLKPKLLLQLPNCSPTHYPQLIFLNHRPVTPLLPHMQYACSFLYHCPYSCFLLNWSTVKPTKSSSFKLNLKFYLLLLLLQPILLSPFSELFLYLQQALTPVSRQLQTSIFILSCYDLISPSLPYSSSSSGSRWDSQHW